MTPIANQTTGQTRRPVLPLLQRIDSNSLNDSGAVIGFSGPYPSSFGENGQCFPTPSSFAGQQLTAWNLRQVMFNMIVHIGSPSGLFQALLFATTGTRGIDCHPRGPILALSNTQTIGAIGGDTAFFTFTSPSFQLVPGTDYGVSLRLISCTLCNNTNYWYMEFSTSNSLIGNNIYEWQNPYVYESPQAKLRYEIDGDPVNPTSTNMAGSPGFIPVIELIPFTFGLLGLLAVYALFEPRLRGGL